MNRKDRRKEQAAAKKGAKGANTSSKEAIRTDAAVKARVGAALSDMSAGRFVEAEGQLRRILDDAPGNIDAVKSLGNLFFETGRVDDAADVLLSIAVNNGDDAELHGTLAACLNLLGRHAEAEAAARFATELDSSLVAAFNNLGVALENQGKLETAGFAFDQALVLDPENADALVNRGNRCLREGMVEHAETLYARARAAHPDSVVAVVNHALALRTLDRMDEALEAALAGTALRDDYPEGHNTLGTVLAALGASEDAAVSFRRALELRPGFAGAAINLGAALYRADDVEAGLAAYQNAAEMLPNAAEAHVGIGVCAMALGQMEVAVVAFQTAIAEKPDHAEALFNLATLGGLDDQPEVQARLTAIESDESIAVDDRINAAFALVEIHDHAKDFSTARHHADIGNALRRKQLAKDGVHFDADAYDSLVNEIIETVTLEAIQSMAPYGDESDMPVFVMGMPRSGTTLVERIIAAHADASSAGERGVMEIVSDMIGAQSYPHNVNKPEQAAVVDAASAYLTSVPQAARVIDKTPFNGLYLGLIAGLFPNASLVRCRRSAKDIMISCYLQNFRANHAWSTELSNIERFIATEDRLFDHWRSLLGARLLEIDYEVLVADQENQSRLLLAHVGLPWSDQCLNFASAPGAVKTASNAQVLKPLYSTSVGRAVSYGL